MNDMSIKRSFGITYRAKKDNDRKIIQGYAVVFDEWIDINNWGDSWKECVRKGTFTKSLNENKILALYNHDFNNVLGRKDVNMTLLEDDKGLYFEIELPNTTQANDLYELINKGIVNQCSFAGYVRKNVWRKDEGENVLREILEIDLIEITITPIPAYEVTEAEVKRSKEIKIKDSFDFKRIIEECNQNIQNARNERYLNE